MAMQEQGLISMALPAYNEVALKSAILSLKEIRRQISENGLDWERDQKLLRQIFGPLPGPGVTMNLPPQVVHQGRVYNGLDPDPERVVVIRYFQLTRPAKDQQRGTDLPRDAAESIGKKLTQDIERFELMFQDWRPRLEDRNRLEEAGRLVPWQEATDRLQRYEGSLDQSFDRTLSHVERPQRMRLGQPVLPAMKLDVSH